MLIVPQSDDLQVEAKVNPQDIDKLRMGQTTLPRFFGFQPAHHTRADGRGQPRVARRDHRLAQRAKLHIIRVSMPREEMALGKVTPIPGVLVESSVQTGDRTLISYLMKPLSNQLMRVPGQVTHGHSLDHLQSRFSLCAALGPREC
jgi:HlyD family secretion protein